MSEIDFENDEMKVSDSALADISTLANKVGELDEQIEFMTASLKTMEGERRKLLEEDIPTAMDEAGVSEFKTTNGRKVTVADFINASITKANESAAFAWLESNNHGSLIKSVVTAAFDRKELEKAKEAVSLLSANGVAAALKQSVHASTLKAFAKEQFENGVTLPTDIFSIYQGRAAKIK